MSYFMILLIALIASPFLSHSQSFYTVTIKGSNFPRQKIKLVKYSKITEPLDSALVEGDFNIHFTNSKEIEPMWYVLKFENPSKIISLASDENVKVSINWQDFNQYNSPGKLPSKVIG